MAETLSADLTREAATLTSGGNEELALMWKQVQATVVRLAGGEPAKIKADLTIEDVLTYVDRAQEAEKNPSDRTKVVRNVFSRTLQCIQHIGSIVASGASMVYGPSSLCFNALSFLIQAWQGYEGMFESLSGLLEKCVEFLDRLTYYTQGGMDEKLTRVACQHLQLFVEICDRACALRRSFRMKLKVLTKLVFLGDDSIKGLLSAMAKLVDKEGHLVSAQIFNFSSQAASNTKENLSVARQVDSKVGILLEDRSQQQREREAEKARDAILRVLAFDEENLHEKEPIQYWQSTYNGYRKSVLPNSGDWIFQDPLFTTWRDGSPGSQPILVIEGGEGSGKSHLASTVIRHLRTRVDSDFGSDIRWPVSMYFVGGASKSSQEKRNQLDVIAKALIWQLILADSSYQRSVSNICRAVKELDPRDILNHLLVGNADIVEMKAVFFIVIDGLGQLNDAIISFLQRVAGKVEGRVRLLLTAPPKVTETLHDVKLSFGKICISAANDYDVKLYINSKLASMEIFMDTNRPGIAELREKILGRLCKETTGDFFKLENSLNQIALLDSTVEIDKVLDGAGKTRSDQIVAEIKRLNSTRSSKEIGEINELILWVVGARSELAPSMMDSVLYLKNGEFSLLPIDVKLRTKYTIFGLDATGCIDFTSSEIKSFIPQKMLADDETLPANANTIEPSEVAIVQHFLRTVCPPTLYGKFGFDLFFEQKFDQKRDYIYQDDQHTVNIKLAVVCLRVLTEPNDEKLACLRSYAISHFVDHLKSVDLALVDRKWKSVVGQLLLKLFTDLDSFYAFYVTNGLGWDEVLQSWVWHDDNRCEIARWFSDSAVISEIHDADDRRWVAEISSTPQCSYELLRPSAEGLAARLFRTVFDRLKAHRVILFLKGYVNMLDSKQNPHIIRTTTDIPLRVSNEEIFRIEDWAQKALFVREKDSLWEYQMASIFCYQLPLCINRCEEALRLDPTNWRATLLLAISLGSKEDAIKMLEELTACLDGDEAWMREARKPSNKSKIQFTRGHLHWKLNNHNIALSLFEESMKLDPINQEHVWLITFYLTDKKEWHEYMRLVEALGEESDAKTHPFASLFVDLAHATYMYERIICATIKTGRCELLVSLFEQSLLVAEERGSLRDKSFLRYHYGYFLYQLPDNEAKAISLWEGILRDRMQQSYSEREKWQTLVIKHLAPIYLSRAQRFNLEQERVEYYIDKLNELANITEKEEDLSYLAKFCLARYYRVQGDEKKAKAMTRSVVQQALEVLSDHDPDNDFGAFTKLAQVFLVFGDEEASHTAWAMAALAFHSQFVPHPQLTQASERAGGILVSDDAVIEVTGEPPRNDDRYLLLRRGITDEEAERIIELSRKYLSSAKPSPNTRESVCDDQTAENIGGTQQRHDGRAEKSDEQPPLECAHDSIQDQQNTEAQVHSEAPSKASNKVPKGLTISMRIKHYSYGITRCSHCDTLTETLEEVYCCRECVNVYFHSGCYERLQEGTLEVRLCNKDHTFMKLPKYDHGKMSTISEETISVGEKFVTLAEWKEEIRSKYVAVESG